MNNIRSAIGRRTGEPERARAELLDVQDVAALLKVSPRTVYRLADSGKMPRPYKLGSLVRWRRTAVDAWIAEGCKSVRQPKAVRR